MPVFLKDIKRELQSDLGRVGKNPDGTWKFIPPAIVGRRLKDYPNLRVSKLSSSPTLKENAISFTGLVSSETQNSIRYKVTIEFHDLKFREMPSSQFNQEVTVGSGSKKRTLYHRTPTVQKNPVRVKCQCKDMQHRFEWPLWYADGLIGAPTEYTRKTDPWNKEGTGGYPSVNSTEKLGICKHINSLLEVLRSEELIKER